MEWRDKGILLATKQFGETSLIIDVFTPDHGKASGVVRGGQSKKLKPILQIGAQLDLTWKARLQEHLCLLYTSPSPRDLSTSRMPSSA